MPRIGVENLRRARADRFGAAAMRMLSTAGRGSSVQLCCAACTLGLCNCNDQQVFNYTAARLHLLVHSKDSIEF